MDKVKLYGADWCAMTARTRRHLDAKAVPYEYVDLETHPEAAEWVKSQNGGKEKKPTLQVAGEVLSTPDNDELDSALRRANLIS